MGEVVHRYDGHCRHIDEEEVKMLSAEKDPSFRLSIDSCDIEFTDRWQGVQHIH